MKAEELMIGDWYYDQEVKKPRQWHQLQFAGAFGNPTYMVLCQPIPLTEEILNANDWTHEHRCRLDIYYLTKQIAPRVGRKTGVRTQKAQFYKSSDGRVMTKYHIHGYDRNYEGSIHYVHELQNIFKMCGLLELADSFKIQ